jgi:hypothetical protein
MVGGSSRWSEQQDHLKQKSESPLDVRVRGVLAGGPSRHSARVLHAGDVGDETRTQRRSEHVRALRAWLDAAGIVADRSSAV